MPNSMTFTQKFVISASKDAKRNETVLMQLSCWHNIKAGDYGHLNEGKNNYDHLAQKQVCDPQPDENVNSTLFCSEKNTEP